MRRLLLLVVVLMVAGSVSAFASDWGKAGKALTIVEGLRLITGGRVDIIGSIAGLNSDRRDRDHVIVRDNRRYHHHDSYCGSQRIWVPHYAWVTEYVPAHTEYRHGIGEVMVGGYYTQYQVEDGGHWETKHYCRY